MTVTPTVDRNRQGWDIAVTILANVLNATFLAVAGFVGLFSLSFIDICPDGDCNTLGGAAGTALVSAIVVVVVFLIGLVVSLMLLVNRRRGWWVAVGAGVIMVVVFFVGFVTATSSLTPLHQHPRGASTSAQS